MRPSAHARGEDAKIDGYVAVCLGAVFLYGPGQAVAYSTSRVFLSEDVFCLKIDEPALREGLPLRRRDQAAYLRWAVDAFRLTAGGVRDETQIHTHMCYADFAAIIGAVIELDVDVISIETARTSMEDLAAFVQAGYPSEVGPGVYDIHSPRVPTVEEMTELILAALQFIAAERLWINPDCGLKTRRWEEVWPALRNMVEAAKRVRRTLPR